ncbi:MAG: Hsp70 family protein, partial [Mycobacterium sp.]
MDYSLGVDLGTTFVTAAIASAARVEMFTLGDHSIAVPAAVYLREDGTLVTGEAAGLRAMRSPDRVSREFKRLLGNPSPVILGGQPHTVTSLLGALLRDVLHKVAETQGQLPDRIALTHPASWGPFHRARFDEVPRYAGLHNPPMVTEPEAAATHYASSRLLTDGETVAVYDLGGATFEATVLRKVPGGTEILGIPERIEQLGGATFDEAILSYIDYAADGAVSELNMRDSQTGPALARLRQNCILAKEALSVDAETILPVFLPSRHFDVRLTRSRFENMVQKQIESTIAALSRTLDSAQVKRSDLSAVLLVGGSSRIPLVAQMLSAELGRPTVVDTHPEHAIALGAATFAAQAPVPPAGIVLGTGHQQRNAQPSRSAESPTHAATPRDTTSHDTIVSPRPRTTQTDPRPEAPMAPTNTVLGTGHQQRNAQPSRSAESPIHAATPRNTTP